MKLSAGYSSRQVLVRINKVRARCTGDRLLNMHIIAWCITSPYQIEEQYVQRSLRGSICSMLPCERTYIKRMYYTLRRCRRSYLSYAPFKLELHLYVS